MARAFVIAIVGAESTGKTTLATALCQRLRNDGIDAVAVYEYLREWCDAERRTPRRDEQATVAQEQSARIDAAARAHAIVVADTTALMTAIYSELLFADVSLHAGAIAAQRRCDLTLVTALDLPWQADGQQRDGEPVRAPVDALLRAALARAGIGYAVVGGSDERRVEAALAALGAARRGRSGSPGGERWTWSCEHCDDGSCERHLLFTSLHRR